MKPSSLPNASDRRVAGRASTSATLRQERRFRPCGDFGLDAIPLSIAPALDPARFAGSPDFRGRPQRSRR